MYIKQILSVKHKTKEQISMLLLRQSNLVYPVLLLFGNLLLGQKFLTPESARKKLEKSKM